MTKPSKLYTQLLQSTNRSVDFRDFVAMIEAFGFINVRVRGSHRTFAHSDCLELLVVQPDGKDAMRYQVRKFLAIVEENGLKLDE
jgi:predicted RNA binding protein YcfA (HicA-like mRNA interferase family)